MTRLPQNSVDLPPLPQKREMLNRLLAECGRVAVAFSGGVDSAVVAYAAQVACGDKAIAVTSVSPSLASGEREMAELVAKQIGIRHRVIQTNEFQNPSYLQNKSDRCYFCKSELYTQIEKLAPELGVDVVVNGANLDDIGDYRPGMSAAAEHRVRSPLIEAGITKSEVRELAREWGLPVWDKPASPCLSSRIAYGLEVTPERVARVDQAEQFLRALLGINELRVRHEAHDLARIEVPVDQVSQMTLAPTRETITRELRRLGFRYITIDLDGFRSGSMNAVLPVVQLSLNAEHS